jgi:hypothetical protein
MMKQLLMLGFLAIGLLACAPNQTASKGQRGSEILRPGQVWEVQAITITGQAEKFSITTADKPGLVEKGVLGYEDRAGTQLVDGTQSLTGIYYDPVDGDPEFMVAGWIRTNPTTKVQTIRWCFSWIAPEQNNFQRLEGKYATSKSDLDIYTAKNDASRVGTCTITRTK